MDSHITWPDQMTDHHPRSHGCLTKYNVYKVESVYYFIAYFKGDMTRYLLMSMNLGIWKSKHDFI